MKQKKIGVAGVFLSTLILVLFLVKSTVVSSAYGYARTFLVPSTFGKTHFIRGFSGFGSQKLLKTGSSVSLSVFPDGGMRGAFFPPDDNVRDLLVSLVEQEQEGISIAAYTLTDRIIANALRKAKERGITITIVTDLSGLADRYNKIVELSKYGVGVFVYNPQQKKHSRYGLMHNKFMIFAKNISDKALVLTGSCNFTKSGNELNQENVVVLDDPLFVDKFTAQFERLKKRSDVYTFQSRIDEMNAIKVAEQ